MILFTAIFSTISIIQDREGGFLQGVLVAPIPRQAVVLGKVLGGSTLALLQAGLFLLIAPLAGIHLELARLPLLLLVLFLVAFGLTAFGVCLAWPMRSIQGFHALMNLVLMPMWLLSGAFFPAASAPGWLATAMQLNPLSYGMAATRHGFGGPGAALPELPAIGPSLAVTTIFALATLALATWLVASDSRRSGS